MAMPWKEICNKLKMSGMSGNTAKARGGSINSETSTSEVDTTVTTNSSTPKFNRSAADNEWQMNYMIINKRDGL